MHEGPTIDYNSKKVQLFHKTEAPEPKDLTNQRQQLQPLIATPTRRHMSVRVDGSRFWRYGMGVLLCARCRRMSVGVGLSRHWRYWTRPSFPLECLAPGSGLFLPIRSTSSLLID